MKMNFILRVVAFLFGIIKLFRCGQIFGGDIVIDFGNSNKLTQITVKFLLSTKISREDYIKIQFPFPLHNFLTPSGLAPSNLNIPTDLLVQYQLIDDNTNLPIGTIGEAIVFTQSVESFVYYLQFLDSNKDSVGIDPNKWYNLVFTVLNINATNYQKGSEVLQISMFTVSSTIDSTAIIYDENIVLGTFYLNEKTKKDLVITTTFIDQTTKYMLDTIQAIYIDIDLTNLTLDEIDDEFRIQMVTDNSNFRFVNYCFSAKRYELPTIPQMSQLNYTCNLDLDRNIIKLNIKKVVFEQQQLIRVQIFVQNPPIVELSGRLEVRLLRYFSPQVIAAGYSYNIFQTQQIVLSDHQILLGWGLKSHTTLPMELKIIRGNTDSSGNTYEPLNSVRVLFQVNQNTPSTSELKINVNLKQIPSTGYVLQGSIMTNLPAFSQKEVICIETGQTTITNRKISCQGVGQLLQNTSYFISFKIFFPYDGYQDDILTENFGSIRIESIIHGKIRDRVFIIARSNEFVKYMIDLSKSSTSTSIQNKVNMVNSYTIADFLSKLKDFPNIKLLFRASDFAGYLEDVVIHNRSYKFDYNIKSNSFDDFVMPIEIENFITFANTKINGLQIVELLLTRSTDYYPCSIHTNPLVTLSVPKNEYAFKTINGKRLLNNNGFPIVSSRDSNAIPSLPIFAPGVIQGMRTSAQEQFLVFNTQFTLSTDITSQTDYTKITNDNQIPLGVGFIIMMNPAIIPQPNQVIDNFISINSSNNLQTQHTNTKVSYNRYYTPSSINQYTSAKIIFNSGGCLKSFVNSGSTSESQQWLLSPFQINQFSSNMVDENVFDFYFTVVDQINGPTPNQVVMTTALFNAYFVTNNAFNDGTNRNVQIYLSNMFQETTQGNDGLYVPTVIKIEGKLTSSQNTKIKRFAVFFDNIEPFYKNSYSNEIYCGGSSNEIQISCKGYTTKNYDKKNYLTLSRVEIQATNLQQDFYLIIPVTQKLILASPYIITMYLAGMNFASFATGSSLACVTTEVDSYKEFTSFQKASPILSATSVFKLTFASPYVGKIEEDFILEGTQSSVFPNVANSSNAALVFTTDYQFFDSSKSSIDRSDICYLFKYSFDQNSGANYYLQNRFGIYCRYISISTTNTNLKITVLKGNVPYIHGQTVNAYASFSDSNGQLNIVELCTLTNSISLGKILSVNIQAPIATQTIIKQVFTYTFTIPVDLNYLKDSIYFEIAVTTPTSTIPYQFNGQPDCELQIDTALDVYNINDLTLGSTCTFYNNVVSDQSHVFKITDIQGNNTFIRTIKLKKDLFEIIIQGYFAKLSTLRLSIYYLPRSSVSSTSSQVKILLSAQPRAEYIAESDQFTLTYQSGSVPNVKLVSLTATNSNTSMRSNILVKFDFLNRFWWAYETLAINMDQFAGANNSRKEEYKCQILESDNTISYRFQSIDITDLSNLIITPRVQITKTPSPFSFYLSCVDMIIPPSPNTFSYKIGSISLTNTLTAPAFTSQPSIGVIDPIVISQIIIIFLKLQVDNGQIVKRFLQSKKLNKLYLSIGSNLELEFTLLSSKVDLQGSLARVLISFPFYYQPRLSKEDIISCQILEPVSESVTCYITQYRMIEIRYFRTLIPKNTQFKLSIRGVTQPLSYSQGTFYIFIDSDDDDSSYDEYFTILDDKLNTSVTSMFNTAIEVNKLTIRSNYLREDSVKYQYDIFISSQAPNIQFGQAIMISFPNIYDQPLRVNFDLKCNSTDFDFCSQCTISGLRIKMYVSETMQSGQSYSIIVYTLRNPGRFDASVQKWVIEVSDIDEKYIIMRSFDTTANYIIDTFIQNPYQSYINFYDSTSTSATSNIVKTLSLIKGVLSDWIYVRPVNLSTEKLWKQSYTLTSRQSQLETMKVETRIVLGTLAEEKIRIYSDDAIGEYDFQIYKYGDSNFYSDLNIIRLKFSDKNKATLALSQNIYEIYTSVITFDVYLKLSGQQYLTNLDLIFTVPSVGSLGLKLGNSLNQYTVSFNDGIMIAKLPIIPLDRTQFSPSSSVTLTIAFSGTNASSYQFNTNTIQFKVIADPTSSLTLSLTEKTSSSYINYKEFDYSCNQKGYFYYYVALYYQEYDEICSYTKDTIKKYAWTIDSNPIDNILYPCNSMFGLAYIDSLSTQNLQINNLLANRSYRIGGFCLSQTGISTDITSIKFNQSNNSGKLYKIQVDLQKAPTIDEIIKILCYFSIHFNHHPSYISTLDGLTCKELAYRRLLREQKILDIFSKGFSYKNNKKRMLQSSIAEFDPTKCTSLYQINTSLQVSSINFYIDLNEVIPDDSNTPSKILTDTSSGCFVSHSNNVLLGVSNIINIYKGIPVDSISPASTFDSIKSIYTGNTWAYIDKIQLSSMYGRLWGVLVLGEDITIPKPRQIRAGLNGSGGSALTSRTQEFDFSYIKEFNATFTGLKVSQTYIFYYVLSNENPFQSIQYSSVQTIKFTTEAIPVSSQRLLAIILQLLLGVLIQSML